jgi:hypothetical protein
VKLEYAEQRPRRPPSFLVRPKRFPLSFDLHGVYDFTEFVSYSIAVIGITSGERWIDPAVVTRPGGLQKVVASPGIGRTTVDSRYMAQYLDRRFFMNLAGLMYQVLPSTVQWARNRESASGNANWRLTSVPRLLMSRYLDRQLSSHLTQPTQ